MRGRFPLNIVLVFACSAMFLVPGDAVARGGGVKASGVGNPTQQSAHTSSAEQTRLLLSDMSRPSERLPAGVPSWWDWADHPRTHSLAPLRAFRAFTAWGQLYQCARTLPAFGARVDLRNLQAWVLFRYSAHWQRIQFSSALGGAAFAEDYAGPTVPGRYSASSTGTSAQLVPGHNFHFWPDAGRVSLDASKVAEVTVALEARLDPTRDHSPKPCFVLSVGGDMWSSRSAQAGGSSSGDVGIGRFKSVERDWRLYTMTTASADVLRQKPLPLISTAAEDF